VLKKMGGKWESPTLFFSLFLSARARLDQTQKSTKMDSEKVDSEKVWL